MTFQETLDYLYACLPMYQRIGKAAFKKDLANTHLFCEKLGNPQDKFHSIHIAGTNGKGSSAHMIAAILQSAGYRVGLYTSPHLKRFTERIRVNGGEMEEEVVVQFVDEHKDFIEKLQPSFFEMTVALAFDYFARKQVDFAVVEVGLGGRFDSTNIVNPVVSLITGISDDHKAMLGDSLPEIAYEKAGIIKKNTPVVISEYQPDIAHVFCAKAESLRAPILFASWEYRAETVEWEENALVLNVFKDDKISYERLKCGLTGSYQTKNIPGVLKSIDLLSVRFPVSEQAVREGLLRVKELTGLKGRWQLLKNKPLTICDTAHNPGGLKFVFGQLERIPRKTLRVVFGMVNDKATEAILKLLPIQGYYYFCQADIPRALNAETLYAAAAAVGLKGEIIPDVNAALDKAMSDADQDDLIFIGGSSFVVAEINDL